MTGYVRTYRHRGTGEEVRGLLHGSGGTAVPLAVVAREVELARAGCARGRLPGPRPGWVRIDRWPESNRLAYDDPRGSVDWPLADLVVVQDGRTE